VDSTVLHPPRSTQRRQEFPRARGGVPRAVLSTLSEIAGPCHGSPAILPIVKDVVANDDSLINSERVVRRVAERGVRTLRPGTV
jgi:hypothetical protein